MTDPTSNSNEQVREAWSTGSYPTLARTFLPLAARLVAAVDLDPQDRVLDVACGTGNVALTAARRGAAVTGVDITPTMLDTARERAAVIDVDVDWREGDAADLPFADDAFDVTLSCLGHMFAHDATGAASELVRVTRPGGRIAYISWTPTSAIAAMLVALSEYLPPEPDASPPFLWGDPDVVRDRFGDAVADLRFETDTLSYPAVSPAHFWESMTVDSGPIILALENLDTDELSALREEEIETLAGFFSAAENAVELQYRLVTAPVEVS